MPDHDLLVRAARLYFELGETQEHVAEQLGVNRPQVSRLLKEARACGIVEIRINDGSPPDRAVADALGERFSLRSVHLVARLGGPEDLTRRLVAQEAARILRERIRDGMIVGVGGGATTGATIEALADQPVQADVTVVPLTGGMSGSYGPMQLVSRLADILGGLALELPAPGVMESAEIRDALCRHVAVDAVLRVWGQLDVALVGVGVPSWSPSWFGSALADRIRQGDAAGEMLAWPYDLAGRSVVPELAERIIAMHPAQLTRVPTSLVAASGDAKVPALLGALRAGYVKSLVTDVTTAMAVLRLDDETRARSDLATRVDTSAGAAMPAAAPAVPGS
jgi:DNA-binding transcriptional regulator LsrR (DeoR family)